MLNASEYLRPLSVEEAAALLKKKEIAFLAGGTDFIPLLKLGLKEPRYLASLSGVAGLGDTRVDGGTVTLGARVTLTEIAEHEELSNSVPALCQAARAVASPQIRNRGTVGGNLFQDRRCLYFNQSEWWRSSVGRCFKTGGDVCRQIPNSAECRAFYYSDVATALLALGSTATVYTDGGRNQLPLEDVIADHLASNGRQEYSRMLLTEVRFPVPRFSCFSKFAERFSFDFPLLNFSAVENETGWRAFAGGWGTRPVRLLRTEEALDGGKTPEEAADILLRELKDRREAVKEAGLSPKMRENLPLRALFVDLLNTRKKIGR